jgi:hypothetical protein
MSVNTIYTQFKGKMVQIGEAHLPQNANFVITWKGMDWSGFRTLAECEEQFGGLESKDGDHFEVVEK